MCRGIATFSTSSSRVFLPFPSQMEIGDTADWVRPLNNTDADYLLSAAELADVFDPVVYNALNEKVVLWSILAKDDLSQKGNNQVE